MAARRAPPIEDSTNLRCYRQMQRFGLDLLYPWQRYVDGLVAPRIAPRAQAASGSGSDFPNPIYTPGVDGTPARTPSLVFFAGIVGVPWQDLADEASFAGRGLTYLTAAEMYEGSPNRWDVILGDPDNGVPPLDPFMIESIEQRPAGAAHPLPGVNAAITPAGGARNAINGHEMTIVHRDDLQYACIFDLVPDVPCTPQNGDGCDCNASEQPYDRPTCQYAGNGGDGTQTHAKAYPSIRQLQVLKGVGDNAIVASVCPKNAQATGSPAADPDYGYNPAVSALVRRFKDGLRAPCFPRALPVENDRVECRVVEARLSAATGCSCASPGRSEPRAALRTTIEKELAAQNLCAGSSGIDCSSYCVCEIEQFAGDENAFFTNSDADPGNLHGFCYVDPDRGVGNPALVANCPNDQRRLVRFMGDDVPAPRSVAFAVCGDSAN